jgi:hypothetical protein
LLILESALGWLFRAQTCTAISTFEAVNGLY